MTPTTRSVAIGVSVAALILGVTACSGGWEVDKQAASSPSASPSPVPPPAPVVPVAATKNTAEGGKAFVGHYINLINHAFTTDDTTALALASAPECRGCRELIGNLAYANAYGRHSGGNLTLTKTEAAGHQKDLYGYLIHFDKAKYNELDKKGAVLFSLPAAKGQKGGLVLQWKGGKWRVGDMQIWVTREKKKEKNDSNKE